MNFLSIRKNKLLSAIEIEFDMYNYNHNDHSIVLYFQCSFNRNISVLLIIFAHLIERCSPVSFAYN